MLGRSAHVDTFTRDNLPPPQTWPELIFALPELRYPEVLNCADALLDRWVESGQGDRPCLVTEGETWSYARVWACANQVAHLLVEDLGLVPGNRVLLRGPNHPWLIACWFAVLKAGGVVVTTVPMLRAGELRTIGEMAAPAVALCDARHLDAAPGGRQTVTGLYFSHVGPVHETSARGMDRGVGIEKESADHAGIILVDGVARIGGAVRLFGHERRAQRQPPPRGAGFNQQAGIEHPQPGGIGQPIPVLSQGGRVLRIDG